MTESFKEQVVGTWELLEYTREDENGDRYYPFGEDAIGYLIYTEDGYMSASLSTSERAKMNYSDTGDLHTGTEREMAKAAHTYHTYTGKYEVDQENQTLYHYMEMSLVPNRIGQVQDRTVQVDGDEITISSSSTSSYIKWKKAKNNRDNVRNK